MNNSRKIKVKILYGDLRVYLKSSKGFLHNFSTQRGKTMCGKPTAGMDPITGMLVRHKNRGCSKCRV